MILNGKKLDEMKNLESGIWPLKPASKEPPKPTTSQLIYMVVLSSVVILVGSAMLGSKQFVETGWILIGLGIIGEITIVLSAHNELRNLDKRIRKLENESDKK